jgi:hypothetical protein
MINCYLRHDPNRHLNAALKRLESIAPDSQILSVIANQDAEERREFVNKNRRANFILPGSTRTVAHPSSRKGATADRKVTVRPAARPAKREKRIFLGKSRQRSDR